MNPIVRVIAALPLLVASLFVAPAAFAVDSGDIVVAGIKGEVHFTVNGAARTVRAGGVLEPPATLRTGRDGSVELKQGATTVSVGPDTLLEFPALEKRGAPIDRIQQPRGNAFYDIGKRAGRKLRIETPYLVGVVKGTQFNVAAQDDSTTISLFEGALEIRAADDSSVVDLKPGEIASRKRGDTSIGVTKMDAGKAPATSPPAGSGSNNDNSPAPPSSSGDTRHVDNDAVEIPLPGVVDSSASFDAAAGVSVAPGVSDGVEIGVNTSAGPVNAISVIADAAVDTAPTGVAVETGTSVDAGPVSVDAGSAINIGGASVDVSTNANVNTGPVSVDVGAGASLGSGVDLSTTSTVDAGPVSAEVGSAAAVDAGAGMVDTATSVAVDAGPLTTDAGASAAVDLGTGTVDTGVTVGASAPGVVVDVGNSVAADAVAGTVNLGLDVAGVDLGVDVDLGLDDADSTPATPAPENTNTVVDVGGLLDGLLRRPGRR